MNDMRNMQGNAQMSVVSRCDATLCRYNQDRECHAGQIEVAMNGQMAQCMTYSPEEGRGDTQRPGEHSH